MYAPTLCVPGVTAAFPNRLSHAALPVVIDGVTLTAQFHQLTGGEQTSASNMELFVISLWHLQHRKHMSSGAALLISP